MKISKQKFTRIAALVFIIVALSAFYIVTKIILPSIEDGKVNSERKANYEKYVTGIYENIEGVYEKGENSIEVTKAGDNKINIKGVAVWTSPDSESVQTNIGTIEGVVELMTNKATYKDGECEAGLIFVREKLYVLDNKKCGGMNVSFSGEYVKKSN